MILQVPTRRQASVRSRGEEETWRLSLALMNADIRGANKIMLVYVYHDRLYGCYAIKVLLRVEEVVRECTARCHPLTEYLRSAPSTGMLPPTFPFPRRM